MCRVNKFFYSKPLLDYNENKEKPLGKKLEGGKLLRKIQKSVEQLRRHDSDVKISNEPTEVWSFTKAFTVSVFIYK